MTSNELHCLGHPITQEQLRASDISVAEFVCPGGPERCPEAGATGTEIVLPRGGLYKRHNRYGRVFADRTMVLFFDADEPFEIHHPTKTPDVSTVVSLSDRLTNEICTLPGQDASPFFSFGATLTTTSIELAHHALLYSISRDIAFDFIDREETALLLVEAVFTQLRKRRTSVGPKRDRHRRRQTASRYKLTDEVSLYLNENFTADVNLQDVAAAVNRSPFHLCHIFKKYTGRTIHQHLMTLRLDSALKMLKNTKRPIIDIALELGYSSHSHFTAMFKQKFGMTPLSYRNST